MVVRDALGHLSKSRVDRAGERLRLHAQDEIDLLTSELEDEREIANDFRAAHGRPLETVKSNLAYHVNQATEAGIVGQRLKRLPTIEDKLTRHPKMKLSRMQDIAGCRAVVSTEAELRNVEVRLREARGWSIKADAGHDYIANPKADGYRAVHLIERRHGCLVEVQLRTFAQHAWAEAVERLDRQSKVGELKLGRAPAYVGDYYAVVAELIAVQERHEKPAPELLRRFEELGRKVRRSQRRKGGTDDT